jgi:SAM-dependent methyltransferase
MIPMSHGTQVEMPPSPLQDPRLELIPCPGCGSGRAAPAREVVADAPPGAAGAGQRFGIVRCDACGLHFTNPRPRLEALGDYYPSDYAPHGGAGDDGRPPTGPPGSIRDLVLRHAFGAPPVRPTGAKRWLAAAVATVRRPESFGFALPYRGRGRLLDFGCGGGKFLRRMAALGWDVTGIDFSAAAVAAVRATGLRAVRGTLPHPDLAPESFDVVTMRHALEHVPDPRAVLAAARDLLAPGGLLLVQVPHYDGFDVRCFGDAALALDVPRHLTHFTAPTLRALLERCGYARVQVRQRSHPAWIRKAARAAAGNGSHEKPATAPSPWSPIFRTPAAARLAATLAPRLSRGNELIATALR